MKILYFCAGFRFVLTIMKILKDLITLITICACSACGQNPEPKRDIIYQVATLQSLMAGNYDAYTTVGELRKHGDFGLGTFESIDGEMVVLDGTVYQARYDGSVKVAADSTGVPFGTVSYFDCDFQQSIGGASSMKDLQDTLNQIVDQHGKNQIYIARIEVADCDSVIVRSETPQAKPWLPLAGVMKSSERQFIYTDITGTIVAVYFPSFFASQNTPGWHLHFISADRCKAGHMLEIACSRPLLAQFDITPNFELYLPAHESFRKGDLTKDFSKDIKDVER